MKRVLSKYGIVLIIFLFITNFLIIITLIFRHMKFHNRPTTSGTKRVASEEIIEIEDLAKRSFKKDDEGDATERAEVINNSKKISGNDSNASAKLGIAIKNVKPPSSTSISVGGLSSSRNLMKNLVKKKPAETVTSSTLNSVGVSESSTNTTENNKSLATSTNINSNSSGNALSLLAGYDDDSDSNNSD